MELMFTYVLLPVLIFAARVVDVSLGTIRIIFISKGLKFLSFVIGFFEVLIWLIAINQIWSNFSNVWLYIAYAGGFATGNYIGIWLDEKIALGNAMIRIIIKKNSQKLINEMKQGGYQITVLNGRSGSEKIDVKVILSVVKRKELKNIFKIVKKINPGAFYTVEDIRSVKKNEYLIVRQKSGLNKKFK